MDLREAKRLVEAAKKRPRLLQEAWLAPFFQVRDPVLRRIGAVLALAVLDEEDQPHKYAEARASADAEQHGRRKRARRAKLDEERREAPCPLCSSIVSVNVTGRARKHERAIGEGEERRLALCAGSGAQVLEKIGDAP